MNFKEIINLNKNNVKKIIKSMTKEENEDLEQEVYIKVYKNSKSYVEKGNFRTWINTIAKNISFDYLKSASFKKIVLIKNDDIDFFDNIKDEKINLENELILKEKQKRILNEINKLKPKLKEIIILTEFMGLTYEQAAKKLNCPIGTVKSRIFNAKKELIQKLNDIM